MSDLRSRDVQTAFEFVRECETSPDVATGEEHLVLLEEGDDPFSPGRMAAFGLSPRESDVLRLASPGCSPAVTTASGVLGAASRAGRRA